MLPAGASVPETGSDIRIVWNPGDVHYMDQAA
jgi:putative spermidine/putrescine transport system ATP-binding protein